MSVQKHCVGVLLVLVTTPSRSDSCGFDLLCMEIHYCRLVVHLSGWHLGGMKWFALVSQITIFGHTTLSSSHACYVHGIRLLKSN